MRSFLPHFILASILLFIAAFAAHGESLSKEIPITSGGVVSIVNRYGKIEIFAAPADATDDVKKGAITATSDKPVLPKELQITTKGNRIEIEVLSSESGKRIDLNLRLPERTSIIVETNDGAVMVTGDLASINATTVTGTVAVDVPDNDLRYDLEWTESRPRYVSDLELNDVKEKAAGRFVIKGSIGDKDLKKKIAATEAVDPGTDPGGSPGHAGDQGNAANSKKKKKISSGIDLKFTTARGIVLLNVPPNEVSSDLRERPLTNAAKAIVRSGDSMLMEAIRRSSPKYFGDFMKTLPPIKREPSFASRTPRPEIPEAQVKRALIRVIDNDNRTVSNLGSNDFTVTENDQEREIVSVEATTAPVNLVLLLDVSGSVENYVNFIRKAARSFVETVNRGDRISIVIFNEDVKVLSGFTTDRAALSKSLDTFDAGGGTAYYDALGFTLADTLRPLKGERTAIVVLTDGDDNRSFLPFDSLAGSIQESGALIYPLYVPSTLVAASANADPDSSIDPLRTKYMGLTTKAEGEGERLAKISGGKYYPISQLSQIQEAYDDIVRQLRTAYVITYRGTTDRTGSTGRSPKLKIRTTREGTTVSITSVTAVN